MLTLEPNLASQPSTMHLKGLAPAWEVRTCRSNHPREEEGFWKT